MSDPSGIFLVFLNITAWLVFGALATQGGVIIGRIEEGDYEG